MFEPGSDAPRLEYLDDIAQLPKFTLIAGTNDEAFHAAKFEPTISTANDKGTYHLLDNTNHLGVIYDPRTIELIVKYLGGFR